MDFGERDRRILTAWQGMHTRCYYPAHDSYARYGGRGIKVWKPWHEYKIFEFWARHRIGVAVDGTTPERLSLDRIDNDGNYSSMNCRFVTAEQQMRNRSNSVYLECNGERKLLVEWAEVLGVRPTALRARLRYGWTIDRTLSVPVSAGRPRASLTINDETRTLQEWAAGAGIGVRTLRYRLAGGMSPEAAVQPRTR